MKINEQYKDQLLKNQLDYFHFIKESRYGKLISIPEIDTSNISDYSTLFDENKKIMRRINDCRIMRFSQSFKVLHDKNKFLNNNQQIKKRIKEIKKTTKKQVYLSIVTIIKNEGQYIKEWLDFHKAAGVERFYLFDNESDDNTIEILQSYIDSGDVIYIPFPGKNVQLFAYNTALDLSKKTSKWLAIIDADEFLHPVGQNDLKTVLKDYEEFPGIGVNWVVYGPCGHKTKPSGGLCKNYRYTFADMNHEMNCRVKSVIQPKKTMAVKSTHHCWYKKGRYAVDENKEEIIGDVLYTPKSTMKCTMFNSCNILRINHYWTKSEEELRKKCQRGYADGCDNPVYELTLARVNFPLKEDYQTVLPFIKDN